MVTSSSVCRFTSFYNPSVLEQYQSPFRERPLSEEEAFAKMVKNSQKALLEHQAVEPLKESQASVYASLEDLSFPDFTESPVHPLHFTTFRASAQGSKETMEDVSFISSIPRGIVAGVFDGHGGDKVANFASLRFQEIFPSTLENSQGHIHRALEVTSGNLQKEIFQDSSMNSIGSTAVFSVFDSVKHQVITTTIGDSEANIYRKKEGKTFSIPLSCVRDWTSKKDEARAKAAHSDPGRFLSRDRFDKKVFGWGFAFEKLKHRRLVDNNKMQAINTSRTFGNFNYEGSCTHKGKTTTGNLQIDDVIVLTSDGLKACKEADIVNIVAKNTPENLPNALVNYATSFKNSDNVSVVVIYASEKL